MEQTPVYPANGSTEFESAFKLFQPSIQAFRINVVTMILLLFLMLVPAFTIIAAVFVFSAHSIPTGALPGTLLLRVVVPVLLVIVAVSVLYVPLFGPALLLTQLRGAQGQHLSLSQALKEGRPFYWRFTGLTCCLGLMSVVALLLFIVPYIFVLQRYMLSPYYLVDRNLTVFEALKQSATDAKQYESAIWGVLGVLLLIGVSGGVPLIGSLINFVTSLLYSCAPAVRYVQIKQNSTV